MLQSPCGLGLKSTRLKTLHYYRVTDYFLTKPEGETIPVSRQLGGPFYPPEVKTGHCNIVKNKTLMSRWPDIP